MAERQEDIDELLREVNALANEAVADIVGSAPQAETMVVDPPGADRHGTTAAAENAPQGGENGSGLAGGNEAPANADNSASPVMGHGRTTTRHTLPGRPGATGREDVQRVLRLEVPVIVRLAERTMPLSEIISFASGVIIEFDKPWDSPLDLLINNKCIGTGMAVKVGENFGLRVTAVGSLQSRLKAMVGGK